MDRGRRLLLAAVLAAPIAAAAGPTVRVIRIADMAFGPAPAEIRVGDIIEWANDDLFEHTATARDRSFDLEIKPGARARSAAGSAGEVEFYCRYHPGMTGRLTVSK